MQVRWQFVFIVVLVVFNAGIYAELVESEEKEWLVDWDRRHKSEEKE